jgi:hypothetical protein
MPRAPQAHRPHLVVLVVAALLLAGCRGDDEPTTEPAAAVGYEVDQPGDACEALTLLRDRFVEALDEPEKALPDLPSLAASYEVLAEATGSDELAGRAQHARETADRVEQATYAQWGQIGDHDDLLLDLSPLESRDVGWAIEAHVVTGLRTPALDDAEAAALTDLGCDLHGLDRRLDHLQPGWTEQVVDAHAELPGVVGFLGAYLEAGFEDPLFEDLCAGVFGDVEHYAGWIPTTAPTMSCWAPPEADAAPDDPGSEVAIATGTLPFGSSSVASDELDGRPVLRIAGAASREVIALDHDHGITVTARASTSDAFEEDELLRRVLEVVDELPGAPLPDVRWPDADTPVVEPDPERGWSDLDGDRRGGNPTGG